MTRSQRFVIPYCDVVDDERKAIGAVNTIVNRDGGCIKV